MIPGEYILATGDIEANVGRDTVDLTITNTGDRPVQVGSHYHFFETNRALAFDRKASFGKRLNIPSGTAVRFEPGENKRVTLVALGGTKKVYGLNGLTNGETTASTQNAALKLAAETGFEMEGK